MNIKKILSNGLVIGLIIVIIAFVPGAGYRILSWLVPPRLYILLGVVIILVLYKFLIELRNKNDQRRASSVDVQSDSHFYTKKDFSNFDSAFSDVSVEPDSSTTHTKVWSEPLENFLSRNRSAKLVKLSGKPDDFAYCEIGNRCHVYRDEDDEEMFCVFCGDDMIGRLPSSAINYAENNDCPPEDLAVIVSGIDYDTDKDRYYISVYISD